MDLATYISDLPKRNALAKAVGRSPHYLYQVATKRRQASTQLAQVIELVSSVRKESLRPDVWPPRKKAA